MKYLDGDSAIQNHFEAMQESLDTEIATLNGQIEESETARATFDDLLEFSQKMPSNLDQIWTQAPLDLQQKVQNLLFQGGLKYDPETGILNQDNAHTFNQLQHFLAGNLDLVEVKPFGVRVHLVLPGRSPETRFGANAFPHLCGVDNPDYAPMINNVLATIRDMSGPMTHSPDAAEAIWRVANDSSSPLRTAAGADAEIWMAEANIAG